jgi:hypothetical protein
MMNPMQNKRRLPGFASALTGALDASGGSRHPNEGAWGTAILLAVLAAALAFRLYQVAVNDFPLNDGALFYEFVRAIGASFPGLPDRVSYNGHAIPFAYPPLSFWFGALLTRAGVDPLEVTRIVPLFMNSVYVLLFGLLLLRTGHSRLFAALALLFLCTRLGSFQWLIMGGGLSRGFGSVFFLLTLIAVLSAFASRRNDVPWRALILAGLAVGGAILSHLEWGIDAAAAVVLAVALGSQSIAVFAKSCVAAGLAAALTITPWLALVIATHGIEPFIAAGQTGSWELSFIADKFMFLVRSALLNPFVIVGVAGLIWRRQYFWLILMVLVPLITPRHAVTVISLPLSALAAAGVLATVAFLRKVFPSHAIVTAATTIAVIAVLGLRVARDTQTYGETLRPLGVHQRSAMTWVSANTPGSRYAVVTLSGWQADHVAEWFPTLANARSVTTVQGSEWLPDGAYQDLARKSDAMKAQSECGALVASTRAFGTADYVWSELHPHCYQRAGYRPVYRNPQVMIFKSP